MNKSKIFTSTFFRRTYLILLDIFIICLAYILSKLITDNSYSIKDLNYDIYLLIITNLLFLSLYLFTGQYKSLTKYMSSFGAYKILIRNTLGIVLLGLIFYKDTNNFFKFNNLIVFGLFLNLLSAVLRFSLRDFIIFYNNLFEKKIKKSIVIYGAGEAGCLLLKTFRYSNNYNILFFVDDSKRLINRTIDGIPIYSPEILFEKKKNIDMIYLAIPSLDKSKKIKILNKLKDLSMKVLFLPSIKQITEGELQYENFRPIKAEDLLGRDPIKPNENLMKESLSNKVICVSGAGGSIGSEICKQIINYFPKFLILIDSCEENLYLISKELSSLNEKNNIKIKAVLINICDIDRLNDLFIKYKIDILYHAAAYKHVPLVEANPISGMSNNIFSTINLCELSKKYKIEKMVFISSDKAVRPSNIMGATKRVCEIIVKSYSIYSNKNNLSTIFSSVRFGNVLGSSGSVVPLFSKQIKKGGPITLTHPDIIRYFMTVQEAAQLVIQSSALAIGGEIFLLDMGSPVSILSLAKKMISLSGLKLKDKNSKKGDIEIKMTGLRPGEKLYEELLIDKKSEKTENPLIFKDLEKELDYLELFNQIKILKSLLLNGKTKESIIQLKKIVPEWEQSEKIKKLVTNFNQNNYQK